MSKQKYICGILGYPLRRPRSINIWKKYFYKNKINSSMNKFEIKPKNIKYFFTTELRKKNFLAMAVTMPYKRKIIKYLHQLDSYATKANTVNLVLKKSNLLKGYNTDIFGAISTIKKQINLYENIIIIGMGGTGQAIFNYMILTFKKKNYYIITSKNIYNNTQKVKFIKKLNKNILQKKCLIINCTPLGSSLKKSFIKKTPITKKDFFKINKESFIFDIIYSPKKTLLSKLANKFKIKFVNGIKMNSLQAERALKIIF